MVAIFVVSLSIILIIIRVPKIESSTVKTVVYIALGLVMFSVVGFAFNLWENPPAGDVVAAADIVAPYMQFYPALIMAMAISAAVLISYMEKDSSANFFAGPGSLCCFRTCTCTFSRTSTSTSRSWPASCGRSSR